MEKQVRRNRNNVGLGLVARVDKQRAHDGRDDAVRQASRQLVRPLADGLPADANAPARQAHIAGAQNVDGGSLVHGNEHLNATASPKQTEIGESSNPDGDFDVRRRPSASAGVQKMGLITRIDEGLKRVWLTRLGSNNESLYDQRAKRHMSAEFRTAVDITPQRLRDLRRFGGGMEHWRLERAALLLGCSVESLREGGEAQAAAPAPMPDAASSDARALANWQLNFAGLAREMLRFAERTDMVRQLEQGHWPGLPETAGSSGE